MYPYKDLPEELSKQFVQAMFAGVDGFPIADWYLNGPTEPQPIDEGQRIQGLAALWALARYAFAYWDNVPDLDWDAAFRRFLPRAAAAEAPAAYYEVLREFVALLRDGHSYIIPPPWLRQERVTPKLRLYPVAGLPVVVEGEGLPPGTVITEVDGRSASERLTELQKTRFASTDHHRLLQACGALLAGPPGTAVSVTGRLPDGREVTATLERNGPLPRPPLLEREDLGRGRVLVRINGWHDPQVVEQFHKAFPDFDGVTALVIDVRRNGGGNDQYAGAVLARLIDRSVRYITSRYPLYWGAMSVCELDRPVLVTPEDPVEPDHSRPRYGGPVAVLTSFATYSAAEDFCAMFRVSGRGPIIGEPTGGSTGNPAVVQLPGGGVGAVCATRVHLPDGSTFVGRGIQPDIPIRPTIDGIAAGRDEALERALAELG